MIGADGRGGRAAAFIGVVARERDDRNRGRASAATRNIMWPRTFHAASQPAHGGEGYSDPPDDRRRRAAAAALPSARHVVAGPPAAPPRARSARSAPRATRAAASCARPPRPARSPPAPGRAAPRRRPPRIVPASCAGMRPERRRTGRSRPPETNPARTRPAGPGRSSTRSSPISSRWGPMPRVERAQAPRAVAAQPPAHHGRRLRSPRPRRDRIVRRKSRVGMPHGAAPRAAAAERGAARRTR